MKKIIAAILIALFLVSLSACGGVKNNMTELCAYPAVAEDSGNIYYSLNDAVYLINKTTGDAKQIRKKEKSSVYCIAPSADALYLADGDFSETSVYKMGKDGSNERMIISSEDLPEANRYVFSEMFVAEGKLFIKASSVLFAYDIESEKIEKISSDVDVFRIFNGYVYYTNEKSKTFTVYRTPIGQENEAVVAGYSKIQPDDQRYTNFVVVNDMVVLMDDKTSVYSAPVTGGEPKLVSDIKDIDDGFIAVYEGKVYFSAVDKNFAADIYEYNPKSGKVKKVVSIADFNPLSNVKIIDGYLIFRDSSNGESSAKIK